MRKKISVNIFKVCPFFSSFTKGIKRDITEAGIKEEKEG